MAKISEASIDGIRLQDNVSDLAAPAASHVILYAKDSTLFMRLPGGTVIEVGNSGSYALSDLTDITFGTLNDGDILVYNNGGGIWENVAPPATGATSLDELSDVVIGTPATDQFIMYSGSEWINQNVTFLDDILALGFPTKGDIIVYNGSNWVALSAGSDGQVLSANSATGTGLEWVTP